MLQASAGKIVSVAPLPRPVMEAHAPDGVPETGKDVKSTRRADMYVEELLQEAAGVSCMSLRACAAAR